MEKETIYRDEAIKALVNLHVETGVKTANAIRVLRELPAASAPWIPVKTRPMDPEEQDEWEERLGVILTKEEAVIFTGEMPEDGQEILICSKYGHVTVDQCINGEYGLGLESNGDWDCITAWMPLPEPYKRSEDENNSQI